MSYLFGLRPLYYVLLTLFHGKTVHEYLTGTFLDCPLGSVSWTVLNGPLLDPRDYPTPTRGGGSRGEGTVALPSSPYRPGNRRRLLPCRRVTPSETLIRRKIRLRLTVYCLRQKEKGPRVKVYPPLWSGGLPVVIVNHSTGNLGEGGGVAVASHKGVPLFVDRGSPFLSPLPSSPRGTWCGVG